VRVVLLEAVLGELGAVAEGLVGEFVDDGGHDYGGGLEGDGFVVVSGDGFVVVSGDGFV
jgi:hypothetical protein